MATSSSKARAIAGETFIICWAYIAPLIWFAATLALLAGVKASGADAKVLIGSMIALYVSCFVQSLRRLLARHTRSL